MRDIAALLFGSAPGKLPELFKPENDGCGDLDARVREWCQTPPGHRAVSRLGVTLRDRGRMRKAVIDPWRRS
jgi:hypothetical protein